ncbi:Rtr1/RPAP2 family-domain-containing protein [Xylariales sp. AK1849]|nr:Rtr1/RPAP2 family-domain-containing protein [Xylariales sp. AK1849]
MATPAEKPKSILKPPSTTLAADKAAKAQAEAKAREVAVQHAHIIHHRQGVEDQVTDTIVALSKYPLVRESPYSVTNPSPSDATAVKSGIRLFQPSDYDDLIDERNCNGLCGYALCPSPRIKLQGGGEWKIVGYGTKDFNIVPKKEIEKWCSTACARRAMYVKVQLNETAAWERAGIKSILIDLYEEPDQKQGKNDDVDDATRRLAKELEALNIEAQKKAVKDARELALERGDTGDKKKQRSVDVTIQENTVTGSAEEPFLDKDNGHLVLDGYKTKFDAQSKNTTRADTDT